MRSRRGCLLFIISVVLSNCAPTYDQVGAQQLADTRKQVDDGLDNLRGLAETIDFAENHPTMVPDSKQVIATAKGQASYVKNIPWYTTADSNLRRLQRQLAKLNDPSADKVASAVVKIQDNLVLLREDHSKKNFLPAKTITDAQDIIDPQFDALNSYENTIQGGKAK